MRTQIVSYAATTLSVLLTLQLTVVGIMQVIGAEPIASNVRDLGYANWARVLVGLFQLIAVVLLWFPPYRFCSAVLLVFVLVVAVASHLRVHDTTGKTLPAVITLILLLVLSGLNFGRRPTAGTQPAMGIRTDIAA